MTFYTPPTPRRVRNRPRSTNAPASATRVVDVKIPRPARVPSFDGLYRQERYEPERDPFADGVAEREEER